MAAFYLNSEPVSRGKGHSSLKVAAYNSRDKLTDHRLQETFNGDIKKKQDLVYSAILLPPGVNRQSISREELWNSVEKVEIRKDARLASNLKIALPNELTLKQNISLITEYCQQQYVENGFAVDISIHHAKDSDNPHAHVLVSNRQLDEYGWKPAKNRQIITKEHLFEQKITWMETANEHLIKAGCEKKMDCFSYEDSGIPIKPTKHYGVKEHSLIKQGKETEARTYQENIRIKQENGDYIIKNPHQFLNLVSENASIFSLKDIARFANTHSHGSEQFNQVIDSILKGKNIVELGTDEFNNKVYTSRETIEKETLMVERAKQINGSTFPEISIKTDKTLTQEQSEVLKHISSEGGLKLVSGIAGTGKSYMLGAFKESCEKQGYKVIGICPTHKAAESLELGSGIKTRTVNSQQWYWETEIDRLNNKTIVVLDEAAMLDTTKISNILDRINKDGAKLVSVYDKNQLCAISSGNVMSLLEHELPNAEMKNVIRQKEAWMQECTRMMGSGKPQEVKKSLEIYNAMGHVNFEARNEQAAIKNLIKDWSEGLEHNKDSLILSYTNASVKQLNEAARNYLKNIGTLPSKGIEYPTSKGKKEFCVGDKIVLLGNDIQNGLKNGTIGIVTELDKGKIKFTTNNGNDLVISSNDYKTFDHGYALTTHKAQGITVNKTYLLASQYFNKNSSYVACTRHREDLKIYGNIRDFKKIDNLFHSMSKEKSKLTALEFSKRREINYISPDDLKENNRKQTLVLEKEKKLTEIIEKKYTANEKPGPMTDEKRKVLAEALFYKTYLTGKGKLTNYQFEEGLRKNNVDTLSQLSQDKMERAIKNWEQKHPDAKKAFSQVKQYLEKPDIFFSNEKNDLKTLKDNVQLVKPFELIKGKVQELSQDYAIINHGKINKMIPITGKVYFMTGDTVRMQTSSDREIKYIHLENNSQKSKNYGKELTY